MKKSSFLALVLGAVSAMLFSLGMCMTLLPAWEAFRPGIALGCLGLALGLTTWLVWRKMERKAPIRISGRAVGILAVSILGALTLGAGMCLCMVWNNLALGIPVGMAGILVLLTLVPLVRGFQEQ